MESKFIKKILFSYTPLKGWYRYREAFQIVPVPPDAPKPPKAMGHYPFILELSHDPCVYPDRDTIYWHRDIWEQERFEEMDISNHILCTTF